jgi:hypothetical protein
MHENEPTSQVNSSLILRQLSWLLKTLKWLLLTLLNTLKWLLLLEALLKRLPWHDRAVCLMLPRMVSPMKSVCCLDFQGKEGYTTDESSD